MKKSVAKKNTKRLMEEETNVKPTRSRRRINIQEEKENKIFQKSYILLIILLIVEIVMIPVLVFCGIKKPIPVVIFLVLPALSVIIIYLLIRSILNTTNIPKKSVQINHYDDKEENKKTELENIEVIKKRLKDQENGADDIEEL